MDYEDGAAMLVVLFIGMGRSMWIHQRVKGEGSTCYETFG